MTKIIAVLSLSLSLSLLLGCHQAAPTPAPITEQKTSNPAQPTNANPDPNNRDCDAIQDAPQAANCRFLKGVAAAKKKHNSDNVVKHSPGSIQQP